ncbi:hemopexin repeat-containing protein [Kitasatospora sp. NPDC057936]|uniref:hemopexin repeat-containing protein n=1 Tax=Kitasatospora sp. NPDC057936 TaxID=3346283 RepID=UPI0036DCECC4
MTVTPPLAADGPTPLLVPIHVDALVVNNQVRWAENFHRWQANYHLTKANRVSPEPQPFSNIGINFAADPDSCGIYLDWQLPQALVSGSQDQETGVTEFPLVPNRWLVVRTHGRADSETRIQTAWMVESDFLDPAEGTSAYLTPGRELTRIGRRVDLADGWSEPEPAARDLFLTAIGPGVATFATYQPYNTNVFSLHDLMRDLAGDPQENDTGEWIVSYLVTGWYSDPAKDLLAGAGDDLAAALEALEWTASDPPAAGPVTRTVYHGIALDVSWQLDGDLPDSPRPDRTDVAIGHTSTDAFESLLGAAPGDDDELPALLGACHHGVLDDLDDADGEYTAADARHAARFTPSPAATTWVLEGVPAEESLRTAAVPVPGQLLPPRRPTTVDAVLVHDSGERVQFVEAGRVHTVGTGRRGTATIAGAWGAPEPFGQDLDTAFLDEHGLRLILAGDQCWSQAPWEQASPIARRWPGLPTDFQADLDAGAVHEGLLFLFKGPRYVVHDIATDRTRPGFPRLLGADFPSLPSAFTDGIDAAAFIGRFLYLFKDGDTTGVALDGEMTWLNELNWHQADHDATAHRLAAAQRRVYDLWWCSGLPRIPEFPGASWIATPVPNIFKPQGGPGVPPRPQHLADVLCYGSPVHFVHKSGSTVGRGNLETDQMESDSTIAALWSLPAPFTADLDAAFAMADTDQWFFKGDQCCHRVTAGNTKTVKPIKEMFRGLQENRFEHFWSDLDAVDHASGLVFFFKGMQYLIYDWQNDTVEEGYPRPYLDDMPELPIAMRRGIDAAVVVEPFLFLFTSALETTGTVGTLIPGPRRPRYRDVLATCLADAEAEASDLEGLLAEARRHIPWGRTAEELQDSIADYIDRNGLELPEGAELKCAVQPDFHRTNDPIVVLHGTKADQVARLEADEGLRCRWPAELITTLFLSPANSTEPVSAGNRVPLPSNLPVPPGLGTAVLPALLKEFFHLDPANAPALARLTVPPLNADQTARLVRAMRLPKEHADGPVPALGARPWEQPWSPLFFQWEVEYYAIPFQEGDPAEGLQNHWDFDGTEYRWRGGYSSTEPQTLRGRQFLTPTPSETGAARLHDYADDHPGPHAEALHALADEIRHSDCISQSLDGFSAQLLSRSSSRAVAPLTGSHTLRTALEQQMLETAPADPGPLPRPFLGWADAYDYGVRFRELRCGQFAFTRLNVVDRFGHVLPVVIPDEVKIRDTIGLGVPAHQFRPVLTPDLAPGLDDHDEPVTVIRQNAGRFVQLTPRINQPARMRLTFLSARDDTHTLDPDEADRAICAWLIPNYLDQSLLCFAPEGAPLGYLRDMLPPGGERRPVWQPLPFSGYEKVDDLRPDYVHLHGFVQDLLAQGSPGLTVMLKVLDRALETISPRGEMDLTSPCALIGRPLALIRLRAQIDLDGPAYRSPSWLHLIEDLPDPHYLLNERWPVRLGERDRLGDSLIGYYRDSLGRGGTYERLYTVLTSDDLVELIAGNEAAMDYFEPIGSGENLSLPARNTPLHERASMGHLTLIADPLGSVHATTDILPVTKARLPGHLVEESLNTLFASFQFAPMLTVPQESVAETATDEPPGLLLPRPSDRHGLWTWTERSADAWAEAATVPADPKARYPHPRPTLHTGALQLRPARTTQESPDAAHQERPSS